MGMFQKKEKENKSGLEIRYVALGELKKWPRNPKRHDFELIGDSIRKFGMRNPIAVNERNGEIEAGHGRIETLAVMRERGEDLPQHVHERDGDWLVPVLFFNDDEITQAKYAIVDNQSTLKEGWDNELLIETLNYVYDTDALDYTGFSEADLEGLKQEYGEIEDIYAGKDADEVPEVPKEARTKVGDIYELPARCGGWHRVMCGDSMQTKDIDLLIDNKKGDFIFLDPPYDLDENYFDNAKLYVDENSTIILMTKDVDICKYVYLNKDIFSRLFAVDFKKAHLIANNAPMTRIDFIACFEKGKTKFMNLHDAFSTHIESVKESSINKRDYYHKQAKKVELPEKFIIHYTNKSELILDLFLGSGSTLIACEKQNRICYGMEIFEAYCDVTVQRYVDFTGNDKIKLNGKDIIWNNLK